MTPLNQLIVARYVYIPICTHAGNSLQHIYFEVVQSKKNLKTNESHWFFRKGIQSNLFWVLVTFIRLRDSVVGDVTIKPSALVTNYGVNYKINKNNFIYGSISTAYRAPNIDDLGTLGIVDFRYEIPSYNLKPENVTLFKLDN